MKCSISCLISAGVSLLTSAVFLYVMYLKGLPAANVTNSITAIVDSDKVISESVALQDIQNQMKEQSVKLQQEFEQEISKFTISKEERDILSEEAKKEKEEQFNQNTAKTRDKYAKKMSELEENYKSAVSSIFDKIKGVSKQMAKGNGISLVLFVSKQNQVLYSVDKVDLSNQVLEGVNKAMPKFTLKSVK